jgi:hypothetical protein
VKSALACGLFRSGTNYCQQLLEANFFVEKPRYYKHAHGPYSSEGWDRSTGLVHVWKSPAQWVDSLIRNSYDLCDCYDVRWEPGCAQVEVSYRLETERWDSPATMVPVSVEKLAAVYDDYWRYWMGVLPGWPGGSLVVRHRNLAFAPQSVLTGVMESLDLARRHPGIRPFVTDVGEVHGSPPFRPELYLGEDTELLRPDHADLVDSLVSKEVKEYLDAD